MKLKQLALITTPEPRLLVVQPFDASTVRERREGAQRIKNRITPMVEEKLSGSPFLNSLKSDARISSSPSSKWPKKLASASAPTAGLRWTRQKMEKAGEATKTSCTIPKRKSRS